jgi:hypothetical protein
MPLRSLALFWSVQVKTRIRAIDGMKLDSERDDAEPHVVTCSCVVVTCKRQTFNSKMYAQSW